MKLKNFILRGKNGWCPEDTWNLDCYLAKVISETTAYLAKTTHGAPIGVSSKGWKKILKQISKDIVIKDDVLSSTKKSQRAYKKRQEALELFVKYFNFLWD